jgi:hypothetical protein
VVRHPLVLEVAGIGCLGAVSLLERNRCAGARHARRAPAAARDLVAHGAEQVVAEASAAGIERESLHGGHHGGEHRLRNVLRVRSLEPAAHGEAHQHLAVARLEALPGFLVRRIAKPVDERGLGGRHRHGSHAL